MVIKYDNLSSNSNNTIIPEYSDFFHRYIYVCKIEFEISALVQT